VKRLERMEEYVESLKACGIKDIRIREDLRKHCTWKVGGVCDVMVVPKDGAEVSLAIRYADELGIKTHIIGAGSNVLFSEHVPGVVIQLGNLQQLIWQEDAVFVGAGVRLGYLASVYAQHNRDDLSFAAGIPGSIGGAVVMNAGAYGKEIGAVVEKIDCCKNGRLWSVSQEEAGFSYRNSIFKQEKDLVVVGVHLKAQEEKAQEEILREIAQRNQLRKEKQPLEYANAGSVFQNPQGDAAGRLIEAVGLKGYSVGDAQISEKHANFIVNRGKATPQDVLRLIRLVQKTVKEKFNIDLKTEVELIGFDEV